MVDRVAEARKELAWRELARRGVSLTDESTPDANTVPVEPIDPYKDRARREIDKMQEQGITAVTAPSVRLPFNDNLAAIGGTIPRMISDQIGPGEAYQRQLAFERERENRAREDHPVLSAVGDVAGGVAAGGILTKGGVTLAGRSLPVLPKSVSNVGGLMAEGAAYGTAMGVDEANGKDVQERALSGAVTGAMLAPITYAGGKAIGKGVSKLTKSNKLPELVKSSELHEKAGTLFDRARASGAMVTPEGSKRLVQNMQLAAGRLNEKLRPNTMGLVEDLADFSGKPMDVQTLHELRQEIGLAMRGASQTDLRTLNRMMKVMDGFIANPTAKTGHFAGDANSLALLREGMDVAHQGYKTEQIEKLFDLADVRSGQYSQSGMMNSLRVGFSGLYKKIVDNKAKGFTPEEIALIRSLAKAETSDQVTKLLSKFAPRGPVAIATSAMTGGMVGGPMGAVAPMAMGGMAARAADKSAIAAAQNLQRTTAGLRPPENFVPLTQKLRPLVPAASGGLLSGR